MTEKEMIEEMAKDIVRMAGLGVFEKAEYLIKLGYRKIPEGSVVLTKEEYEKLTALTVFVSPKSLSKKEFEEQLKNRSNYGIIGVDESSIEIIPTRTEIEKKTVKEILQEMLDFIHNETFRKGYELKKVERKIKEIAKIEGVEVEE